MSLLQVSADAVALAKAILEIPTPEYEGAWNLRDYECSVGRYGDPASFTIEWVAMYERPEIKDVFETMKRVSDLFGTTKIDLGSGRSQRGCETCDHGSEYGTTLTLRAVTKHAEELGALADIPDSFNQNAVQGALEEQKR